MLLPCAKNVCPACAVDHPPEHPHNMQSLYYQYWFLQRFGRWPTWADAIAHCSEEGNVATRVLLNAVGVWSEPEGEPISVHAGVVDGVGVEITPDESTIRKITDVVK